MNNNANGNAREAKQSWHRPAIARIDIKRTMDGSGSKVDFSGAGASNTKTA